MKRHCPFHDDSTESLHLYPDHYHCFGCGAHGALEGLPEEAKPKSRSIHAFTAKEDVSKKLAYIATLPRRVIRGLELPYDDKGYYLVYPNANYYVLRRWDADAGKKYHNPAGHRKSLYLPNTPGKGPLFVVEGQFNAATLDKCVPSATVCSPGAASDLVNPAFVSFYLQYNDIIVIVDKDAAGVLAALKLKETLTKHGKNVYIHAMPEDFNQIYAEKGPEAVREEARVALQAWLQKR